LANEKKWLRLQLTTTILAGECNKAQFNNLATAPTKEARVAAINLLRRDISPASWFTATLMYNSRYIITAPSATANL
jgi:hypothetical protein